MPERKKFQKPPEPQRVDLHQVWAAIQLEAERQLDLFHESVPEGAQDRRLRVMESGISNMLLRGAARVLEDGTVLFWNPFEGGFQCYDEEYNELMMDLMRQFSGSNS